MTLHFHKKFISIVAAASILITGVGVSQANAGDRDAEAALAAVLGLAVIGAIIADDKKDKRRKEKAKAKAKSKQHSHRHGHITHTHSTRNGHSHKHGAQSKSSHRSNSIQPRPLPRAARQALLPQQCLLNVHTRKGHQRLFTQRCMTRNYGHVNKLPRSCERQVRTDRGWRQGWGALCLHNKGYRMARR